MNWITGARHFISNGGLLVPREGVRVSDYPALLQRIREANVRCLPRVWSLCSRISFTSLSRSGQRAVAAANQPLFSRDLVGTSVPVPAFRFGRRGLGPFLNNRRRYLWFDGNHRLRRVG